MSFRRKTYDGDIVRRGFSSSERRDTVDGEIQARQSSAAKRAVKSYESLELEDSPFQESGDKDRYIITYADLITLLLGLFIILYTISKIDSNKYKKFSSAVEGIFGTKSHIVIGSKSFPKVPNHESLLKTKLIKLINKYHYNGSIRLEENKRGITIHILDDVLFASGRAALTKNSLQVLNHLAEILKALPNDIRIEGHTDNVPINTSRFPSNWHLSITRALNTAYYLIHNEGIDPEKVSIAGYSKYKPIDTNSTPKGRANNRRVDIVIVRE